VSSTTSVRCSARPPPRLGARARRPGSPFTPPLCGLRSTSVSRLSGFWDAITKITRSSWYSPALGRRRHLDDGPATGSVRPFDGHWLGGTLLAAPRLAGGRSSSKTKRTYCRSRPSRGAPLSAPINPRDLPGPPLRDREAREPGACRTWLEVVRVRLWKGLEMAITFPRDSRRRCRPRQLDHALGLAKRRLLPNSWPSVGGPIASVTPPPFRELERVSRAMVL